MNAILFDTPYLIQFAKDGKYEEAWKIRLEDAAPTQEEVINYLETEHFTTLAVEYFWHSDIPGTDEVITILYNKNLQTTRENFIILTLQAFYECTSFDALVAFIDREIIGYRYLFQIPMDHARVGVVDYWFSEGPIDIWQKGELVTKETLHETLLTNPKVLKSEKNYQALAGIFNFEKKVPGPYHVLHSPCGVRKNGLWELDEEKLYTDLTTFIQRYS